MFDALDLMRGKAAFTFTGSHYKALPGAQNDEHADFDYEYVDPTEWHFQKLFGNLINNDGATTTIRSNDDLDWRVGEYAELQDGKLYRVNNVMKDYQTGSREVYRFLKDAPQVDFVLRLVEVDNAWQ